MATKAQGQNLLATVVADKHGECLQVSTLRASWVTNSTNAVIKKDIPLAEPKSGELLVGAQYMSITQTTPESCDSPDVPNSGHVMLNCAEEIVGMVISTGDDSKFEQKDFVFCFNLKKPGLSTGTVTSHTNCYMIPEPDPLYLSAGWPMIASHQVFEGHLKHLPKESCILVNDCGSGGGESLVRDGVRFGFSMHALCYHKEVYNRIAPVVGGLHSDGTQKGSIRYLNTGLRKDREGIKPSGKEFSAVVTPALLSGDATDIYELFGKLMSRNSSTLIILCTKSVYAEAKAKVPYSIDRRGIATVWVIPDEDHDYSAIIKSNIKKLETKESTPVTCDKPVCVGMNRAAVKNALARHFSGKSTGGYQYLQVVESPASKSEKS